MMKIISILLITNLLLASCIVKKPAPIETDSNNVETNQSKPTMQKVDGNIINAKLNCEGKSVISFLQLADKKYDTEDFKCSISKSDQLKIKFTSESKNMEMIFELHGIEEFNIESGNYPCKNTSSTKYSNITLNGKTLGTHNFGDTFEGEVIIIDYGMSSNVICGKFNLIDRKGNRIEGTFNEIIGTF